VIFLKSDFSWNSKNDEKPTMKIIKNTPLKRPASTQYINEMNLQTAIELPVVLLFSVKKSTLISRSKACSLFYPILQLTRFYHW